MAINASKCFFVIALLVSPWTSNKLSQSDIYELYTEELYYFI